MKVYIGPYCSWVGPYQIADKIFFWLEKYPDEKLEQRWDYRMHDKLGEFLAGDEDNKTLLYKFCLWLDKYKNRKIKIHIDKYDTWSMDHTLAMIILPMLKQLKDTKHGSPLVELEDVPEELRLNGHEDWSSQLELKFDDHDRYTKDSWEMTHRRWDWVLNEIIFAFEHIVDDTWEEAYHTGVIDYKFVPCEDNAKLSRMVDGPNHTHVCDYDALKQVNERIQNGLRLFGVYYKGLWD